jgi:H+-translocating NAD(P) transhydrogenase subunit alpha
MRIAVPAEGPGERRVAMTPQVALRLIEERHEIVVGSGAGTTAGFSDRAYVDAGAEVNESPLAGAELTVVVGPPEPDLVVGVPEGSVLIGFLDPFQADELIPVLIERRITALAMESIPRTTLAQSMDALSSQATAAGYFAVLLAAVETPRFFPMLTTAAGTIPPVKLLVLGAGVAGLQAIATGRRLGAAVSAYDIRPEVKEQIESLGARFVAAPVEEEAAEESGYAKEVSEETKRRQQQALADVVADSDVVITTAQIPGRPAPSLIPADMVERMRPGSVIVDVAAPTGGNCELTRPGETVNHGGVKILGPVDLPARVAHDASQMYARNLASLLSRLVDEEGRLSLDFDDEIVAGSCITHDGEVRHPAVREAMGLEDDQ